MRLRRLFVLVPDCLVSEWRYGEVWRRVFGGIARSGVDVVTPQAVSFAWARPSQHFGTADPGARERTSALLLTEIEAAAARDGIDAVLSYCFSHDLELDVVDQVRARGIPWINFFCDSLPAFATVEALARRTSLNWYVESPAAPSYEALGVPSVCLPYAFDPASLPDASCVAPHRTVAFLGTAYGWRVKQVALLRLMGVDLHARGSGWSLASGPGDAFLLRLRRTAARLALHGRIGEAVAPDDYADYLRGTQVVLGFCDSPGDTPPYLKLRDIELPGMGCCYVTQRHADVTRYFDVGREVRTFGSLGEARNIARDLARFPTECRQMGERARARVLREHTWTVRLAQLGEALG